MKLIWKEKTLVYNVAILHFKEKVDKKKSANKKPSTGGRNLDALNALAAATEQTLKVRYPLGIFLLDFV